MRMAILLTVLCSCAVAQEPPSTITSKTLLQSTGGWGGTAYKSYPTGEPQLTVLKITIPPHTTMQWHTHPIPSAGYVLSGSLIVEKRDGTKRRFVVGEVVPELVDVVHRGIAGAQGVVLIVFYAGAAGIPLSVPAGGR